MRRLFLIGALAVSLQNTMGQIRPSVFVIIIDDLRPELGVYGSNQVISPTIDSLGASGAVFMNAYSQQALCNPSRASFLTGLRPDELGIYDNNRRVQDVSFNPITMPDLFQRLGYLTIGLGKVFHHRDDRLGGWDFPPRREDWFDRYVGTENRNKEKGEAFEILAVADDAYIDGRNTQEAIRTIEEWQDVDRPLFMCLGYNKPHLPYTAPKKYWDLYPVDELELAVGCDRNPLGAPPYTIPGWNELQGYEGFERGKAISTEQKKKLLHGYLACVSYIDDQIRELINAINESKIEEYVLVIMGDHGYKLGEYNSWSKHTNYGIDNRTPLIINGNSIGSKIIELPVELVDVFPTVLGLVGHTSYGLRLSGKDLSGIITATSPASNPSVALSQYPRITETDELMGYSLRTMDFRQVNWVTLNNDIVGIELYDLNSDPNECYNIANESRFEQVISYNSGLIDSVLLHSKDLRRFHEEAKIKVFPNPVTDFLYWPIIHSSDIEIRDVTGNRLNLLAHFDGNYLKIDFRNRASGIYFAFSGGRFTTRIVKK